MDKKLALTIQFAAADRLSGAMRKIVGLADSGGASLGKMKREARELDRQLKDVRERLASGSLQGGLIMAERELGKAIDEVNAKIERQKRLLQIDATVGRMTAQAERLQAAGRENMFGGAAMLAPFVFAGKAAMDYDKKLALLAQKTDLTAAQSRALGRDLLGVARAAKQVPDTILAGSDFLAGKGLEVAQIRKLMPAIGEFATAWDSDVLDASKAAYANILSLKVPAEQSARALEIMGVAGKRGGFEVKDMARHFPMLASQMATLGAKGLPAVSSLSSALQILEAKTGDGATAANDLNNLMRFTQTKTGIDNFKKLGINIAAEMKRAEKEGRDPLERLAELVQKATGGDTGKIAQLITDQQAGRAALGLVSSIEQYKKIRDEAFAAQGVTAQEFDRMSKASATNWQAMMGSLQVLSITLGTHLLPTATAAIDTVAGVTSAVGEWADRNPILAGTLLKVVVGMGAARLGLGALQFAFGSVLGPAAQAWGLFQKWKMAGSVAAAFPMVTKGFALVRTAALFMAKGVVRAGMLMLGNPMVLAIVAIVAALGVAGYLIYQHWDTIKAAFHAGVTAIGLAWEGVKANVSAGIAWLMGLPGRMLAIGQAIIQGIARGIRSTPGAVWNALKSVVTSGIDGIKAFLGIKSPSRLFMGLGGFMTEGLALGLDRGSRAAVTAARRVAAATAVAAAVPGVPASAATFDGPAGAVRYASVIDAPVPPRPPSLGRLSMPVDLDIGSGPDLRGESATLKALRRMAPLGHSGGAPAPPGAPGAAITRPAAPSLHIGSVEIRLQQQPGESGEDLADRIMEALERKARSAQLGAFRDV